MIEDIVKAVAWPLAVIIGALVLLALAKSGRVRSLTASKEAGIKLDLAPLEARGTTEHNMNRRIEEIDEGIVAQAREEVRRLRKPIQRAMAAGSGLCASALRAVAGELRGVMYGAVDENNLKERLAGAARDEYVATKLATMAEDYADIVDDGAECASASPAVYPPWAEVEGEIRGALEAWSARVAAIVAEACRAKIRAYEEYRPQFVAAGDAAYVSIVDGCIAKNRGYIAALEESSP